VRPVPAPATIRPAGRNLKSASASVKRGAQAAGSRSGAARAVAIRDQVSSIVLSTAAPSGPLSRYFMSQICWEIEATLAIKPEPSDRKRPPRARWRPANYSETIETPDIFSFGLSLSREFVPSLFSLG